MARSNDEVAALFQEYADLVSITGGDAFKARVYEKAARAIGGHHADVGTLDAKAQRDEVRRLDREVRDRQRRPLHPPLAHTRFGVATAQLGRLTEEDVINAWPHTRLRRFLE